MGNYIKNNVREKFFCEKSAYYSYYSLLQTTLKPFVYRHSLVVTYYA